MMNKPVLEIDGQRFSTLSEFYDEVERALIPGAKWGRNLDAFNDILRGGFGTPEGGFILRWKNSALSQERLGHSETSKRLRAMLRQCHPENHASVSARLAESDSHQGPTVFDDLVQIIRKHGEGGPESCDGVELQLE